MSELNKRFHDRMSCLPKCGVYWRAAFKRGITVNEKVNHLKILSPGLIQAERFSDSSNNSQPEKSTSHRQEMVKILDYSKRKREKTHCVNKMTDTSDQLIQEWET